MVEVRPTLARDTGSLLVVLPTWVGDFLMATPFLRGTRDHFTAARITFLIEPNLRDLVRGGPWMDAWVEWPPRDRRRPWHRAFRALVRRLRSEAFDAAVLLPNSFRSALVARLSGAARRVGYDRDARGWLLTDRIRPRNRVVGGFAPTPIVDYYADLAEHLGCPRPDDRLELHTMPDAETAMSERLAAEGVADHRPLVVISPGARYGSAKCWFPDRFAAVADRLARERDAAVVVTCGPGEERIARAIHDAMKERRAVLDDPRLTLGQLAALVRRGDLLVCNDAGPRHLARAFGVPVVTVFGPTHAEWTRTRYPDERIVRIDVDCGPCQKRVCPLGHLKCMTGVSVEAVFSACDALLQARLASTTP